MNPACPSCQRTGTDEHQPSGTLKCTTPNDRCRVALFFTGDPS